MVFTPTAVGAANGTLTALSSSIGNTAVVDLSGTGAVASAIQVTPPNLTFATTGVGQTSIPATVTVTNTGIAATLSGLALAIPAGFQLVNNTCAATLGPGLSCTAQVEFAPTAAGAQAGSLTVTSSTVPASATVALQGMGFDFTVTVSGSSTQSVAAGQNATYTLMLTPLNGSSGTFAFACSSLPSNALCTFNPVGETLNGGAAGNVTVEVSTGGSTVGALRRGPGVWSAVPLVCGVLLLSKTN